MPYDNIISRTDADVFIPVEYATEIIESAVVASAALSLFPNIPMSSKTRRVPVLSMLPVAYWVNGDTGLKQTTEQAWEGLFMEAEEIACIVPIPEAVLDDSEFDIWAQVRPRLAEAIARALDAAVFLGTNKPASWPASVAPAAIAAGNIRVRGTAAVEEGGVSGDISALYSLVEDDGFAVSGFTSHQRYKGLLRNARDANGVLLSEVALGTIYGVPITQSMPGLWPGGVSATEAVAGDFSMGLIGVRQDITYKVLDQAVITNNTSQVMFNLAQQDMLALRVVARFGYQVANPITWENVTPATRYPFAVMRSPAAAAATGAGKASPEEIAEAQAADEAREEAEERPAKKARS
jgi:HK97 family phage major capsid protein